jgi:hypothetical protein
MNTDIPLKNAIFAWNPYNRETNKIGNFMVLPWPDTNNLVTKYELCYTTGAVYKDWRMAKPKIRETLFLHELHKIALSSRAPIQYMKEALSVIPEYRDFTSGLEIEEI